MVHATSVRLEESVYGEAKIIAKRNGISMNALIEMALRQAIARVEEQELYDAATILGNDADADVEYAFAGQSEIVMRA